MDDDGLGSFPAGMLKKLAPTLKNVAELVIKTVGKNALNLPRDVAVGKNFKEVALGGLKRMSGDILRNVFDSITSDER